MVKKIFKIINLITNNFLMFVFRIFPINRRKIFVVNYFGKGFGDNAKYIVEELLSREQDCEIVWAVSKGVDKSAFPKQVKLCRYFNFTAAFHAATAKIWIDNCRKFPILKRKQQVYLQTWHGFALKRIEKDVVSNLGKYYVRFAKADSKMIDLIISDSKFMTQIYQNAFWYDGKVVEWGSPRNDVIIKGEPSLLLKVRRFYGVEDDKKIVLYAPTFRASGSIEAYDIDYHRLRVCCKQRFGGDFVVLVRLHPNIVQKCKDLTFKEGEIINATYYPDMQELLAASDICISDYSSLMFDFALSKKPCFQFATDIEDYKLDRNFYFEIDSLPFPLSKSNDELEQSILAFDKQEYEEKLGRFYKKVGMIMDGNGAKRCVDYILENQ